MPFYLAQRFKIIFFNVNIHSVAHFSAPCNLSLRVTVPVASSRGYVTGSQYQMFFVRLLNNSVAEEGFGLTNVSLNTRPNSYCQPLQSELLRVIKRTLSDS